MVVWYSKTSKKQFLSRYRETGKIVHITRIKGKLYAYACRLGV